MPLASVIVEVTALPIRGHFILGIENKRALYPHPCNFCNASDEIALRHNFTGAACDFNLIFLWDVLAWLFVAIQSLKEKDL